MKTKGDRYGNILEKLDEAIAQMTWLGLFWGFSGALILDAIRSMYAMQMKGGGASALSARSSLYYAAAGNAKARADQAFFTKPFWLLIALLCFMRSLRFSNRFERAVGIVNMSANELDVRSHILRRADRHEKALLCVVHALSMPDLAPNTRVLLLMGMAESLAEFGRSAEAVAAYQDALALQYSVPTSTQVRLLRSLAEFRRREGNKTRACELLEQARLLAMREALGDQLKKIAAAQR